MNGKCARVFHRIRNQQTKQQQQIEIRNNIKRKYVMQMQMNASLFQIVGFFPHFHLQEFYDKSFGIISNMNLKINTNENFYFCNFYEQIEHQNGFPKSLITNFMRTHKPIRYFKIN